MSSHFKTLLYCFFPLLFACGFSSDPGDSEPSSNGPLVKSYHNHDSRPTIDENGNTLETRIGLPLGYERTPVKQGSFAEYLRNLRLKKAGAAVRFFNGKKKPSEGIYIAVAAQRIGSKDLHQCADAVMRLKADYLYQQARYEEIAFDLTNGFRMDFETWAKGNRLAVQGNKVSWTMTADSTGDKDAYWSYLESLWTYAGTRSLEKELKPQSMSKMKIGDVFIKGGSPGHAVIVVDMAINHESGEKLYLLAQSYMPAQELQVLINPNDHHMSPWYKLTEVGPIETPEWKFDLNHLRTW